MLIHTLSAADFSLSLLANSAAISPAKQETKSTEPVAESDLAQPAASLTSSTEDETSLELAEIKQLQELRNRDREVRAHELAHLAVAGALAISGPAYDFERGPDGQLYAVGGEVHIDTSAEAGDPEATLDKARQIRSAALAPAQPSA